MKNRFLKITKKVISLVFISLTIMVCSCIPQQDLPRIITAAPQVEVPRVVKTLSLEAPLRCDLDYSKQEIVTTIPYENSIFSIERVDIKDPIPRYEVTDFSFEPAPTDKILSNLLKEAEIRVLPKDGPYSEMSAEGLKGELSEVINMITDASEIYYTYDARFKVLELKRRASFILRMPKDELVIIALLDALRGAGVSDVNVDWEDKIFLFDADKETEAKINELINNFAKEASLIAFEIDVYRFLPKPKTQVNWQDLLNSFERKSVKMSIPGVLGKLLVTSSEINHRTLPIFLSQYGSVVKITSGRLILPNGWKSRFDVGRCGSPEDPESDLSILAESSINQDYIINTKLTLDTTKGEITSFSPRSRIGESYLIIEMPTNILGHQNPYSENVFLINPRIIRIVKKDS